MIRTNIYLPEDLHKTLQRVAKEEGDSMAEFVRKLLQEKLNGQKKFKNGAEMFSKMLTNAKKSKGSGLKDLAKNHDYYLYGAGRKD